MKHFRICDRAANQQMRLTCYNGTKYCGKQEIDYGRIVSDIHQADFETRQS
jgi:hypothetical protein